jgi:hypothetical protein
MGEGGNEAQLESQKLGIYCEGRQLYYDTIIFDYTKKNNC